MSIMYIRVTTRCNMSCIHCLYSCSFNGTDMSLDTFKKAVDIAYEYEDFVCIGGGEPTLNLKLIDMLGYAVLASSMEPSIITNGTCNKRLWNFLINVYNKKLISLYVSRDPWHDYSMVRDWVIKDANRYNLWYGSNMVKYIVLKGRALENRDIIKSEALDNYDAVKFIDVDPSVVIEPDGSVYAETNELKYVGELNEDNVNKAREIVYEFEE